MYLVAFSAGWLLARLRAKKPGSTWKPADVDDFMFFCMLGTILGGRLGYVFFYGMSFWAEDKWYPLKVMDGGMSFHGGLIGVMVALAFLRCAASAASRTCSISPRPLPGIGIFAGRIGNFINGELWGKTTDVPWGFMVDGEVRHATQLYEAGLEGLLLFIIIWWYTAKPRPLHGAYGPVPGAVFAGAHHGRVLAHPRRAHQLPGGRLVHHGHVADAAHAAHRPHADVHGLSS